MALRKSQIRPIGKTLLVAERNEWRRWLKAHHLSEKEIWLIFYKKSSGRQRLPYELAVEEALCYGWIDSLVRRIDDLRYAQKFTPRRPGSRWSPSNRRRVARLMREGRMTASGLAVVDFLPEPEGEDAAQRSALQPPLKPPAYVVKALKQQGKAWVNFKAMAPSYSRLYLRWIVAARRPETRARRVREAVERLARNEKLGLK